VSPKAKEDIWTLKCNPSRPSSAVSYAVFACLEQLLIEALQLSSWSENDTQDAFDKEILAEFLELMIDYNTYKTREECRI